MSVKPSDPSDLAVSQSQVQAAQTGPSAWARRYQRARDAFIKPMPDPDMVLFYSSARMQVAAAIVVAGYLLAIPVISTYEPHPRFSIGEHLIVAALALLMGLNARQRIIFWLSPITVAVIVLWIAFPFYIFWTYMVMDGGIFHLCTFCLVLLLHPNLKRPLVALVEIVIAIVAVVVLMRLVYGHVHIPSVEDLSLFALSAFAGSVMAYATRVERHKQGHHIRRVVQATQTRLAAIVERQQGLRQTMEQAISPDDWLTQPAYDLLDDIDRSLAQAMQRLDELARPDMPTRLHIGTRRSVSVAAVVERARQQVMMDYDWSDEQIDQWVCASTVEDFLMDAEASEISMALAAVMQQMLQLPPHTPNLGTPSAFAQHTLYVIVRCQAAGSGWLELFCQTNAPPPGQAAGAASISGAPTSANFLPVLAQTIFRKMKIQAKLMGSRQGHPDHMIITIPMSVHGQPD